MKKELLNPEDPNYNEGISELYDFITSAIQCGDAEEDFDGNYSLKIDMLPLEIPTDSSTRKEICRDLCELIDMHNRESDRILEDAAIGNGDFYEEEPEFYTPPANAYIKNNHLVLY